jgi:hypothetical protein
MMGRLVTMMATNVSRQAQRLPLRLRDRTRGFSVSWAALLMLRMMGD